MKRMHVHVSVADMSESVRFYSTLFGLAPAVVQSDYAKWMLEDPRLNFAISRRGQANGLNHFGFQVESDSELHGMRSLLEAADAALVEQTAQACCYARSDKYWVTDPQGIAWETFHTLESIPVFGEERKANEESNCCIPLAPTGVERQEAAPCCLPSRSDQPAAGKCC